MCRVILQGPAVIAKRRGVLPCLCQSKCTVKICLGQCLFQLSVSRTFSDRYDYGVDRTVKFCGINCLAGRLLFSGITKLPFAGIGVAGAFSVEWANTDCGRSPFAGAGLAFVFETGCAPPPPQAEIKNAKSATTNNFIISSSSLILINIRTGLDDVNLPIQYSPFNILFLFAEDAANTNCRFGKSPGLKIG